HLRERRAFPRSGLCAGPYGGIRVPARGYFPARRPRPRHSARARPRKPTTRRRSSPRSERWWRRPIRPGAGPTVLSAREVRPRAGFRLPSYRHCRRRVYELPVPQLKYQEAPERIAVIGRVVRLKQGEQLIHELAPEITALARPLRQQHVARHLAHAPVGFHPGSHRNAKAVLLFSDHLNRQEVAERPLEQVPLVQAFYLKARRDPAGKLRHRAV